MKIKLTNVLTILIASAIGLVLGVLLQKYYSSGNILDILGGDDPSNLLRNATGIREGNVPEEYKGKLQILILAGQSNMSGRGDLPAQGTTEDPRIYVFGNDYHWRLAVEPIDDAANQVDKVSEALDAGFGPAPSFAATVLERCPDMVIGLIPCATGNSSIYEWRKSWTDDTLYGSCLKRTRAASAKGKVAGLLFFQGEADALDPKQYRKRTLLPDQWEENLLLFVRNWRTDLGLPELPVVFAEIGTTSAPDKFPNWAIVQEQQRGVQLPFVAMIPTQDLALKDEVHFTTQSYQMIGQRFAEAYLDILEEQQR